MKVNIQLPSFNGFYESIWSNMADTFIEDDFRERGIIHGEDWRCKWDEFQEEVVRRYTDMYIDLVNSEMDFRIQKIAEPILDSPRYYNYRTDRIYVDVEFTGIKNLWKRMFDHKNELSKIIKEHHTSYDGFISFMSNDFGDWVSTYLHYNNEDFGLYLSFAIYYLVGIEHGWDLDYEFYDLICGDVSAEWYPDSEVAKEELEKVEAVEAVLGFGAYNSEKWEDVPVEEVKRKMEELYFDRKYQLNFAFTY